MDIKVDENTVIVFDLDDTLYNEIDFLRSAYLEIAKEFEPDAYYQLFSRLFSLYRNKEDIFEFLCNAYSIEKEDLINRYRNHIPNIFPFEGVLQTINQIKTKKGKIAILTDGRSVTQRNKLKKLGLLPLLDFIVISEEIGTEKPNIANFKAIEDFFNANSYYYFGDNYKKDFVTPNQRGWTTVALIDSGLNIHSNAYNHNTKEYMPQLLFNSYLEINII